MDDFEYKIWLLQEAKSIVDGEICGNYLPNGQYWTKIKEQAKLIDDWMGDGTDTKEERVFTVSRPDYGDFLAVEENGILIRVNHGPIKFRGTML